VDTTASMHVIDIMAGSPHLPTYQDDLRGTLQRLPYETPVEATERPAASEQERDCMYVCRQMQPCACHR
jgi:hypothetical protein